MNVSQVNLDDSGVLGIGIAFEELRIGQPGLHRLDAAVDGAHVGITRGDHPLQHGDVAVDVFDDRLFVQVHGAATGAALGGRIAQFKGLLHLQIWQAFDFENTTRENVDLALLVHRQQPRLDGVQRNGVDQVAQRHTVLHLAFKANQNRLGHVQRHHARGGTKRDQAGACGEADANGEAGVAVTASADCVGQQHAVQPTVDDAVTRTQGHTAAGADEVGQLVVHLHVHRLGVRRCVAEGLHHQVSAEAQAGQVFELVARHRASRILRADRSHFWLAIGARANSGLLAVDERQATGATDHFLCQRVATATVNGVGGQAEQS